MGASGSAAAARARLVVPVGTEQVGAEVPDQLVLLSLRTRSTIHKEADRLGGRVRRMTRAVWAGRRQRVRGDRRARCLPSSSACAG